MSGSLAEAETDSKCHYSAGLRMRVPSSLLVGLMWFDPELPNAPAAIRHNAEDRDGGYRGEPRLLPAGRAGCKLLPLLLQAECTDLCCSFELTNVQVGAVDASSVCIAALYQPLV